MTNTKLSIKDILTQVVFLAIGIGLFWYVLKDFKLEEIKDTLLSSKIAPIIGVILISILGHVIRGWRWQLLMDETGKTNFWNLLFSLQLGYFVSLAIPRIGEFVKCFTSAETEKKPITYVLGTTLSERIVDLAIMALLVFFAFIIEPSFISDFWATLKAKFPEDNGNQKYYMIGGILLVVFVIYPLIKKMIDGDEKEKQLTDGLKSVFFTKQKGKFIILSLFIWVCYFLTSYLLFFCFDPTSILTLKDGFFTMMGGTVSRMLPINGGGIGAFHFVIENLLESFGVDKTTAVSYAILNHGLQFFFQITVGIIALIFLGSKIDIKKLTLKL